MLHFLAGKKILLILTKEFQNSHWTYLFATKLNSHFLLFRQWTVGTEKRWPVQQGLRLTDKAKAEKYIKIK